MRTGIRRHDPLHFLMQVLALAGFAINLRLLIGRLSGGGIAGCGGGGGSCEELLSSRWSQVLGIPVTVFGVLVYLGLMLFITTRRPRLVSPCLGLIGGAAVWFVFVQAVLTGRFCPWCMTAHGIGLVLVMLGGWRISRAGTAGRALGTMGLAAAAAVAGLGVLQVLGPPPATYRISGSGGASATVPPAAIHARGPGRKVVFDDGRKTYALAALPHLGRADAPRVMVEYFDYGCPACQTMRGFLDALLAKHPAELCVVILPVPLERSCNPELGAAERQHLGSCELARLALAVWRARPEAFAAYHHYLLDGASPALARAKAQALLAPVELAAALRDPWIEELVQADSRDWVAFSADTRNLPKLLITGRRILHGLPSGAADFIRVIERELGL